ncbi:MAG: hypothetical protein Q8R82_11810 [Hyphomonadaceae bacterium]|nr:hypothetical protein [Hyphomonadaceae bacterium]
MRNAIVIGLAIIALLAGGVWALGQFGGGLTGDTTEARAPLVREPEIVIAEAPAQPVASNPQASLRTAPAAPAKPAAPTPAKPLHAEPTAPAATATPDPAPTTTEPAAKEPAAVEPAAPAKPPLSTTLDGKNGLQLPTLPSLPKLPGQQQAQAQLQTQTPAETPAAPAQPEVTAQPQVQARTVQPAEPQTRTQQAQAEEPRVMPQQAGVSVTAAPVGLEAQFKSRKVTYNRPPEKLALDKAIDVSLVINATEDENAGREALQGFPGTVVERDVDLSDTVSAQLTGVGFDITSQTVERQRLSGKVLNRWAWRVTPTETGEHTLILEIFGYASGSLDAEPLDAYRDVIVVEVQQFDQIVSWAKGVQPLFAVLAALAAIGSAVFAFLRFREEKKQTAKMGE